MFEHQLKDLVARLIASGAVDAAKETLAYAILQESFCDRIAIIWTVRDVMQAVREQHERQIFPWQAMQVLKIGFDASADEPLTFQDLGRLAIQLYPNLPHRLDAVESFDQLPTT